MRKREGSSSQVGVEVQVEGFNKWNPGACSSAKLTDSKGAIIIPIQHRENSVSSRPAIVSAEDFSLAFTPALLLFYSCCSIQVLWTISICLEYNWLNIFLIISCWHFDDLNTNDESHLTLNYTWGIFNNFP